MYKVGIIGAGLMGSNYDEPGSNLVLSHAHAAVNSDKFELCGFYDKNEAASESAAKKWSTKRFRSVNELLAMCDIVCCAVSDDMHYPVLRECFSGKNIKAVICEKPLAANLGDASKIIQGFDKSRVPLAVNYSRRFMHGFWELKVHIHDLGRFIAGNCAYGKGLFHNGSHMINILEYLIGLKNYSLAIITQLIYDFDENDPSIGFVLLNKQTPIVFDVIPCNYTTVFQFELFFERGKVVYDASINDIQIYYIQDSILFKGYTNYIKSMSLPLNQGEALLNLYENISNALEMGQGLYSDGISALHTLELCAVIQRGAEQWKQEKK